MSHTSRTASFVTLGLLALFFLLVAYILGPDLLKDRGENAIWYFLHIVGGSVVLVLGPFQFVAPIRNRFRRYHRAAGYTYIVASVMAVVGFIGLPKIELFFTSQLVALALWVLSVLFAVRAISAGKILSHQHNMARSFVLACYFLTARLIDRHGMWLFSPLASYEPVKLAHSDWVAWLVPLALVEISPSSGRPHYAARTLKVRSDNSFKPTGSTLRANALDFRGRHAARAMNEIMPHTEYLNVNQPFERTLPDGNSFRGAQVSLLR